MRRPPFMHPVAGPGWPSRWVKSSLSFSNGDCVEMAVLPDGKIGIRDSKDSGGPVLRFTPEEWGSFFGGVQTEEFDGFGWSHPIRIGAGRPARASRRLNGDGRLCRRPGGRCASWIRR
jgi:hypothetical protein